MKTDRKNGVFTAIRMAAASHPLLTAGTLPDGTHYTNSVLIGYGPVQQPQFAVAVVIEYGGGGSNAAPVLRAVADWFAAAGMA